MAESPHSVLSNLAIIIASTLDGYKLDGRAVLEQVGIDYEYALDPDTRISYDLMDQLWELASVKTADPCFGVRIAQGFNPSLLHGLGFSWMASSSLKEAFGRVLRFQKLINTAAKFSAEESEDQIRVIFDLIIPDREHHPTYALSMLAGVVRMSRLTAGENINPVSVSLRQASPACASKIGEYFCCEVLFDSDQNTITFDRSVIEAPVLSANPTLARINDQIVIDYLAKFDSNDLVAKVQAAIIQQLSSGRPSQATIAKVLNMSLRNLQRKLKQEGTSYRQLLEDVRRQLATQFIRNNSRSIGAISYNLGFTEPANFARSFKSWTGLSPKQYRQAIKQGDVPSWNS